MFLFATKVTGFATSDGAENYGTDHQQRKDVCFTTLIFEEGKDGE
jgi:hypothetical protein